MKNKILILIILILTPIAVISFLKKETNFKLPKNRKKTQEYTIKLQDKTGNIQKLNLEDYVIGVVAGEMPASFNDEALKAQAVASRTYAMYKKSKNNDYDLLTTTSDQVYLTREEMKEKWQENYQKYYDKISKAVKETSNLVIKYNNEIIVAYYFAMSNGYTEDAQNVFNEQKDYLTSVESNNENSVSNNIVKTTSFSKQNFCDLLNITCNNIDINILDKSNSGRINTIKINNKIFTGVEIRKKLNLRSTDFKISVKNENVTITTNGYGHGVGMSQYGADAMANQGYKYDEIIKHYYQNVTIDKI